MSLCSDVFYIADKQCKMGATFVNDREVSKVKLQNRDGSSEGKQGNSRSFISGPEVI